MFGHSMRVSENNLTLELRPYTRAEMPLFLKGMQSYEVCRTLGGLFAQTEESEQKWYDQMIEDSRVMVWGIYIALSNGETQLIGSTSLGWGHFDPWRKLAESGSMIFDRQFWRQGVASLAHVARTFYAFSELDLLSVHSSVMQGNTGSLRALEKVGYVRTGVDYHLSVVDGQVRHGDLLRLVNPSERAWGYFWGQNKIPREFAGARLLTQATLDRGREIVQFL